MAQFIEASTSDAGLMLFSGNKTSATLSELKNSVTDFVSSLGDSSTQLVKYIQDTYSDLNFGDTFKRLRSLKGNLSFDGDSDEIARLGTLEELQGASSRMQRWVMANTKVRNLYLEGELSGYGDGYTSIQEEGLGSDYYDYRRVTNGIVLTETITSEDKKVESKSVSTATTYYEDLIEDDIELSIYEQFNVMSTWDTIDSILAKDDYSDFTEIDVVQNEFDDLFLA